MPRTVQIGSVSHSFPDDATDDEIAAALEADPEVQKIAPPIKPKQDSSTFPEIPEVTALKRSVEAIGETLKGAALEAPLVAERAAMFPVRLAGTALAEALERLGGKDLAQRIREQQALQKVQLEAPFAAQPDASTPEKVGRLGARVAPQLALAAVTGGSSLPVQAAAQGTTTAAQTASEGGTPLEVGVSGALGAAGPAVGKFGAWTLEKFSKPFEKLAVAIYSRAVHPTKEATKTVAKQVVPEMIDEKLVAGPIAGFDRIAEQAKGQLKTIGSQIEDIYHAATAGGVKLNGKSLAKALEVLKVPFTEVKQVPLTAATAAGNPLTSAGLPGTQTTTAAKVVVLNETAVDAITNIQKTLKKLGTTTPEAVWKFRRVIDDIVAASNGFTKALPRGTARAISKDARAQLAQRLTKAVRGTAPEIDELNTAYSFWKNVNTILFETARRQTGQQRTMELMVNYGLGSAVGGGVGYRADGGKGAVTGAIVGPYIVQALRSPFARTWTATHLKVVADLMLGSSKALSTPAGKEVANTLALFGIKLQTVPNTGEKPKSPQSQPQSTPQPAEASPDDDDETDDLE